MDTFNPAPTAFDAIFEHLLDPANHLVAIARAYSTSLRALSDWLDTPEVRRCRDLLDKNLAARARTLALANLPAAITTANAILEDFQALKDLPPTDDPQAIERHRRLCETARRAAALLQRLSLPDGPTRAASAQPPAQTPSDAPQPTASQGVTAPQGATAPSPSERNGAAPITPHTPDRSHSSYQSYPSYQPPPILTEAQLQELDHHRAAIEALLGPPEPTGPSLFDADDPEDNLEDPDPHVLNSTPALA